MALPKIRLFSSSVEQNLEEEVNSFLHLLYTLNTEASKGPGVESLKVTYAPVYNSNGVLFTAMVYFMLGPFAWLEYEKFEGEKLLADSQRNFGYNKTED